MRLNCSYIIYLIQMQTLLIPIGHCVSVCPCVCVSVPLENMHLDVELPFHLWCLRDYPHTIGWLGVYIFISVICLISTLETPVHLGMWFCCWLGFNSGQSHSWLLWWSGVVLSAKSFLARSVVRHRLQLQKYSRCVLWLTLSSYQP